MSSTTEKVQPAKASKVAKTKKPTAKTSSHPPTSAMVEAAISSLKERKGSSLVAIKKYIATNYKVDPVKHGHFIKKALANGVEKKKLIQVKGVGASGSFKLAKVELGPKKKAAKPKSSTKKAKTPSKPKKKAVKSKPAAKKATPKKKVEKSKSAKKAAKPKKPVAKKAAKPSAKKPAKKAAPKKK